MIKIILCVILLSIIPNRSYSFSSEEHDDISNSAFILALIHAKNTGLINCQMACDLKDCFVNNNKINYGRLSKIVDDVKEPSKLINLYGSHSKILDEIDCDKTANLLRKDKILLTDKAMAARSNDDHFQDEPLTKFKEFHDLAVLYAVNKNLTLALVLNAFAVHYLEDFFAPGHVFTPRTDVNNIVAWKLHDIHNKEGAEIYVGANEIIALENYLSDINKNIICDSTCTVEEAIEKIMPVAGIEAIRDNKMKFYGDDRLTKTTGERELIIYEVAKTTTAIFEAYKNGRQVKTFDFNYTNKINDRGYGRYEEVIDANFDDVSYTTISRDFTLGRWVPLLEMTPYLSTPLKQGVNSKLGLELDIASFWVRPTSKYIENGKGTISKLEQYYNDIFWGGIAVGYDINLDIFEGENRSHGPLIKFMWDIRDTNIGISVYAKYMFNDDNGHKFESQQIGGRVTFGFDLFSLFIGVGNESRWFESTEDTVISIYTGFTIPIVIPFLIH